MNENERQGDAAVCATQSDPTREDWFLQTLVDLANKTGFSVEITLNVGGALVCGTLVGGREYFEGFAEDLSRAVRDAALAQLLKLGFSSYQSIYEQEAEAAGDVPMASYIHLHNPRFFNAAGVVMPNEHGAWWRGRIAEVQGFVLGNGVASTH